MIDDTRNFVRKSPGVALAGAAVIGFALVRLVKSGLGEIDERTAARAARKRADAETAERDRCSGPDDERPIGEMFGRLIDEGKDYARAELGLARASRWPRPRAIEGCQLGMLFGVGGAARRRRRSRFWHSPLFLGAGAVDRNVLAGLLVGDRSCSGSPACWCGWRCAS